MTVTDEAPPVEPETEAVPSAVQTIGPPCFTSDGVRLRYNPDPPHAKQAAFLATTCLELFFGGSGGGGKSFSLLAAALQFVDVPGYSALILRRKLTDLTMPGALIAMSEEWLDNVPGASFNKNERKWTFDTGPGNRPATLQFGYLDHPQDVGRYRGTEYHFIGWDELGEFPSEESYTFLFSRLRKPDGLSRETIIRRFGAAADGTTLLDIPLRVRSASNPGGPGMEWVAKRFVYKETAEAPYIPSSYRENPAIVDKDYELSLSKMTEIERARMGDGNWEIQEVPGALWNLKQIRRDEWSVLVMMPKSDGTERLEPRPWSLPLDEVDRFERTVMGIDPTVGEGAGDECGMVIGGQEKGGRVVILADLSDKMHPDVWSKRAVENYHLFGCSSVVVEDNQGKVTLVTQLNTAADKLGVARLNIQRRTAHGTKAERAAVAQQLYTSEHPMVIHHPDLRGSGLEAQMVGWVPGAPKSVQTVSSPDRVDALVWLVREMLYPEAKTPKQSSRTKSKMSSWT